MESMRASGPLQPAAHSAEVVCPFNRHITNVVCQVFRTMMEVIVTPSTDPHHPPDCGFAALVEFTATWHGALAIGLGRDEAARFTSRLLGSEVGDLSQDEIRDVIGEIANIIAGNIKFVLPPGIDMGLPAWLAGNGTASLLLDRRLLSRHVFESEAGHFSVYLLDRVRSHCEHSDR